MSFLSLYHFFFKNTLHYVTGVCYNVTIGKEGEGMKREVVMVNRHLSDLNPLVLGCERCQPGHTFGPTVRKYTLIHAVSEGRGSVFVDGKSYEVGPGEAFLILPDQIVTYSAHRDDPWVYQWIGFDGALSHRFRELPTVFSMSSSWISEMLDVSSEDMRECLISSVLLRMYASLFGGRSVRNEYVKEVRDYIRALYMQDIRVEEIAAKMNLNRRYLSRLFKEKTGQTVQEFLIHVRMEEAKRLLKAGKTVGEAAVLCGYQDPFHFSKIFKQKCGVSPLHWKNSLS